MKIARIRYKIEMFYYFLKRKAFQLKNGYDYKDTWDLDYATAKWILPRLKGFRKNHIGYPGDLTPEEWDAILDKMIAAFEMQATGDYWDDSWNQEVVDEGLQLFAKHYNSLWD